VTAVELLADLRRRGVAVEVEGPALVLGPADRLTADDVAEAKRLKPALLALLTTPRPEPEAVTEIRPGPYAACSLCQTWSWSHAVHAGRLIPLCRTCSPRPLAAVVVRYRAALHRAWDLVRLGDQATPEECRAVLDSVQALEHDLGPDLTTRLRHRWARAWFEAKGACPTCGEHGIYHDPERTEDQRG